MMRRFGTLRIMDSEALLFRIMDSEALLFPDFAGIHGKRRCAGDAQGKVARLQVCQRGCSKACSPTGIIFHSLKNPIIITTITTTTILEPRILNPEP
jgi:hypothetical protein